MDYPLILSASFTEGPGDFATHFHNCHEIIFVSKGNMSIHFESKKYTVESPSVVFISNLEHHSIHALSADYERYCVQVSPAAVRKVIKNNTVCSIFSNRPEGFSHVINVAGISDTLTPLFALILDEYTKSASFSDDMQKSLLRVLLIALYRYSPMSFPLKITSKNDIVEEIQHEFENDYSSTYSLENLAAKHHVSKSHLSHLFKEITGYGVMQYLSEQRLSIAKDLLCSTDMSASKIAEETGFSSSGNFSRFLKNDTGLTPREYRNKHKKEKERI